MFGVEICGSLTHMTTHDSSNKDSQPFFKKEKQITIVVPYFF